MNRLAAPARRPPLAAAPRARAHQAKQRADADVVDAADHGAVLAEQAVVVVALGAGHVHLVEGGAVVRLLEQREGAHLQRGGGQQVCVSGGRGRWPLAGKSGARGLAPAAARAAGVAHVVCGLEAPHVRDAERRDLHVDAADVAARLAAHAADHVDRLAATQGHGAQRLLRKEWMHRCCRWPIDQAGLLRKHTAFTTP